MKTAIGSIGVQWVPEQPFLDLTAPQAPVTVEIDHHRNVLYIHVGPVTVFRMCRITGKIVVSEDI